MESNDTIPRTVTSSVDSSLICSYLTLRRAIGIIGICLPFVLVIGKLAFSTPGLQPSISDYYYTNMRDVFVGSLCAIGVFLMSYRGYERQDNLAGHLACVFAIGTALFPTSPKINPTPTQTFIGYFHYILAAALFIILAYFCLALFRKTKNPNTMTDRKKQRNVVYAVCGYTIIACIILLAFNGLFLKGTAIEKFDPAFWLETIALLFFGASWMTKGDAILKDREES